MIGKTKKTVCLANKAIASIGYILSISRSGTDNMAQINNFPGFAANKEMTVAHEIIQGAPLIQGYNQGFNLDLSASNTISNSEAHESQIPSNWRIAGGVGAQITISCACWRAKTGAAADCMRLTRAAYHYAIRQMEKEEECIVRERIAVAHIDDPNRNFWAEIKIIRS